MAIRDYSIFGHINTFDSSGNIYADESNEYTTNDLHNAPVIVMEDTSTKLVCGGKFRVPKGYVGSAVLVPVWSCAVTANNAVLDFEYKAVGGDNAESLDPTTNDEAVSVTDAAPSTAFYQLAPTISLTSTNFVADDTALFSFGRDGTAADTIVGVILLYDLIFRYSDT